MWHQWFNRNFMKLQEYFLWIQKTKITTLINKLFSSLSVYDTRSRENHACVWSCWCRSRCSAGETGCAASCFQAEECTHTSCYCRERVLNTLTQKRRNCEEKHCFCFLCCLFCFWVINDRMFIFAWTIHLTLSPPEFLKKVASHRQHFCGFSLKCLGPQNILLYEYLNMQYIKIKIKPSTKK